MRQALLKLMGTGNKSIRFYKLFLSYMLLVTVVLVAVGSVVYVSIISTLQKEVEQTQLSSIAQIRDTLDTRLRELQRIALQIASNPLLTPYALSQSGYESYRAVAELGKYKASNSFIHNIVLTYGRDNAGRLFAASGVYEENEFFRHAYRYEHWGAADLPDMIHAMTGPVIRPVETVYTYNGTQKSSLATYLYPLPANSGKPYGAVMFLLDAEVLQAMTGQLVSHPGTALYLTDREGRLIFETGGSRLDSGRLLDYAMGGESGSDRVSAYSAGGVTYSVIRQDLGYNGWSFIYSAPTALFLEKVEQSRRLLGLILLILLAAGAVTSFVLANSNYQKLRQLVGLFADKKDGGAPSSGSMDELVYLSDAIRKVSGQDSMIKSKKGLIRENILMGLLKNKPQQPDELARILELVELRFDYGHYVSVLLVIDDYAEFQAEYTASMQELLKFRILKAAEEQAMELGRGCGVSSLDDRGIVLVLNIEQSSGSRQQLERFAQTLQSFFQLRYHFTVSVGIGRVYDELLRVGRSYEEAGRALQYRFVRGNNQVLFYEELQTRLEEQKRGYPHELEEQLLKSLRQGNTAEAEQGIHSIIDSLRALSAAPRSAQIACVGLLHTLMKMWEELQPDNEQGLYRELESETLIPYQLETIDKLERHLLDKCRCICEYVSAHKESRNFKLRDDIVSFLQERYADSTLTLETIAGHFGRSSSYLTRFMKDQLGYSLIRYLDLIRMDKAKELLLTGNLNLSEITKEVGYVDVSNFIKKFKKIEGVTPEQYRSLRAKGYAAYPPYAKKVPGGE